MPKMRRAVAAVALLAATVLASPADAFFAGPVMIDRLIAEGPVLLEASADGRHVAGTAAVEALSFNGWRTEVVRYVNGQLVNVHPTDGGHAKVREVNRRGVIAAYVFNSTGKSDSRSFLISPDGPTVELLAGPPETSEVLVADVNDAGVAVGSVSQYGDAQFHAAAWEPDGTFHDLGPGRAMAILNDGTILGDRPAIQQGDEFITQWWRWSSYTDTTGEFFARDGQLAISPDGDAVFARKSPETFRIVQLWTVTAEGVRTELQLPPNEGVSDEMTVDAAGNVYGAVFDGGVYVGVVWSPNGSYQMLGAPAHPEWGPEWSFAMGRLADGRVLGRVSQWRQGTTRRLLRASAALWTPTAPPNVAPTAELRVSPDEVAPGQTVTFDGGESQDPDGTVVEYHWDFDGDQTVDRVTAQPKTTHTYTSEGLIVPRLEVRDDNGELSAPAGAGVRVWDGDVDYVALGDSYSAGEGNVPYYTDTNYSDTLNRCHRSLGAYSHWVSLTLEQPLVRSFFACSGAVTFNLWRDVQYPGEGVVQVERPELNASTDLVTLTIGGNDIGFAAALGACGDPRKIDRPVTRRDEGDCTEDGTTVPMVESYFAELPDKLDDAFEKLLDEVSDHTTVIVAGYPLIFPDHPDEQRCSELRVRGNFNQDEQNKMREFGMRLNRAIADAARRHGIWFASVSDEFTNHLICERPGPSYLNSVTYTSAQPGTPEEPRDGTQRTGDIPGEGSYHPNPDGQRAYARVIEDFIQAKLDEDGPETVSGLPRDPRVGG